MRLDFPQPKATMHHSLRNHQQKAQVNLVLETTSHKLLQHHDFLPLQPLRRGMLSPSKRTESADNEFTRATPTPIPHTSETVEKPNDDRRPCDALKKKKISLHGDNTFTPGSTISGLSENVQLVTSSVEIWEIGLGLGVGVKMLIRLYIHVHECSTRT